MSSNIRRKNLSSAKIEKKLNREKFLPPKHKERKIVSNFRESQRKKKFVAKMENLKRDKFCPSPNEEKSLLTDFGFPNLKHWFDIR